MPSDPEPEPHPWEHRVCGSCGIALPAGRLGSQCPRCLLTLATQFDATEGASAEDGLLGTHPVRDFGDYELIEEIARGGMGVVYRAHQRSLRREVAVKMIIAGELAGKDAMRRFRIEAHAAAHLHHPNIVPVYEIGEQAMQPYFTMRFVSGGRTIADWAAAHREDHLAIAATMARVARAVAHAHMHSVLHRDLKPSNILWDADAGPQVTDFGLARLLDREDGTATHAVQAMGSPSYMAPEQMNGRTEKITTATDVYGLGAVLYELLAGRPPFAGASALETMRQAAEEAPAPLPGVPRDLRTICLTCLAKDPEDRYASAATLAEDLECFARGEPVSVVPLNLAQSLWRWARRRPGRAALIALCLGSILAGLGGVLWQWRQAEFARREQARALAHLHWQEIDRWLADGDTAHALAYLAFLIREQPGRWPAVMYAMSIVEQSSFPVLAGPEIQPAEPLAGWACLAPDGSWYSGAGNDRVVRVWDTATGRETAQFPQVSAVTALAVAGGPAILAVATQDGALTLRAPLTAPPVALARDSPVPIQALSFSADGSHLLARSPDYLEVWLVEKTAQPPQRFSLVGEMKGASLSADGARTFAWNGKEAAVWDSADGREILRVSAIGKFRRGALAPSGARIALIDGKSSARVWDLPSGRPLPPIEIPLVELNQLAFDAAGRRLTLGGNANDLTVIDIDSGLPVSPPMQHHYAVTDLIASPDGSRLASYGWDGVAKLWDARTGHSTMLGIPLGGGFRRPAGLSLSRDGGLVLTHAAAQMGSPQSLSVWRATAKSAPRRQHVEGQGDFDAAVLSPDGRISALGLCPGNRCYLYELKTGKVVLDKTVEGPAYVHLFAQNAGRYYVLTANGWLHGWSLSTGQELWPANHQPGAVRGAALSPDGARIVVGHLDGHIRVYDAATGQVAQTLYHPGGATVIRFAHDGSGRFVSGGPNHLAYVWDLTTGRPLQTFTGHADTVISADWSADGRRIATGSYDETARLWDVTTGQPIGAAMNHAASLSHLEFSPDGRRLATACRDGTARLWNGLTGRPLSPPLLQGSACETVRFTADGTTLLVRDHGGFRFWDTATAEPVTVHYTEPEASGLGMDSDCYRAIVTGDGRHVFLGHSMTEAALWTIPQPRGLAPVWLPDFLEMLAQIRRKKGGEFQPVPRRAASRVTAQIRQAPPGDEFAAWAARILGLPTR